MVAASILIVDDEPTNLSLLTHVLRPEYQVRAANSGASALRAAAGEPRPDLVLLDVMMPGMDGLTTFRRLREQPATAAIPVVFVTAKVQRHEVQRYLDLGAIGVIGKPFDPMTLPDELRAIMARSRGEP